MDGAIRVLLVDESVPARIGVRHILERAGGYSIVGETGNVLVALELIEQNQPQVVLLDCRLSHLGGIQLVGELQKRTRTGIRASRSRTDWDARAGSPNSTRAAPIPHCTITMLSIASFRSPTARA